MDPIAFKLKFEDKLSSEARPPKKDDMCVLNENRRRHRIDIPTIWKKVLAG